VRRGFEHETCPSRHLAGRRGSCGGGHQTDGDNKNEYAAMRRSAGGTGALATLCFAASVTGRGLWGGDVQGAAVLNDRLPFNIRVTGYV